MLWLLPRSILSQLLSALVLAQRLLTSPSVARAALNAARSKVEAVVGLLSAMFTEWEIALELLLDTELGTELDTELELDVAGDFLHASRSRIGSQHRLHRPCAIYDRKRATGDDQV